MMQAQANLSRRDAAAWRRLVLTGALAGAVVMLPSCSAWSWTKDKLGFGPPPPPEIFPAPAPAPTAAAPVAPPPVAPVAEPSLPPTPMPIAPPPPVAATPLPAEAPRAAMPVPPAPSGVLRQGRYGVQVGVFLVAANAETIRARVASQLAGEPTLDDADKVVRSVKKGQRTHVVVGDVADRRAAEELAARLRSVLRQDVVVFQR
jgi:cell division protein FtsN